MNRFLTAISVALVVVVAVMGLMLRDQDRRLRAVEQRLTARPASVAVRSAGTKLTEADKRRLDREVEDLDRWTAEYEYITEHARPIKPGPGILPR